MDGRRRRGRGTGTPRCYLYGGRQREGTLTKASPEKENKRRSSYDSNTNPISDS